MLRKLITLFMVALMLFQAPYAAATDLNEAFNNLMPGGGALAANQPGYYQSSARNSFIAGGLEMRVPRNNSSAQLFSVTPPSITANCNGVSAYFGGFSFISGKEFEQLVKNIASGAALGFVTMLTLKSLCPTCADVVQQLKNAAQVAARLSIDACKLGKEAYKAFTNEKNDFATELCGTTISGSGATSDFLKSVNDKCTSTVASVTAVKETTGAGGDPADKNGKSKAAQVECKLGTGNATWNALGGPLGDYSGTGDEAFGRKILLMNMMGAVLRHSDKQLSCEQQNGPPLKTGDGDGGAQIFCAPTVSAIDITGAFMCGTDPQAITNLNSPGASKYCAQFFKGVANGGTGSMSGLKMTKLLMCKDNENVKCENLVLVPFDEAKIFSGVGFIAQVGKLLQDAVSNVRDNLPLTAAQIALMQAAPYPLYQAVNAAAVYPVAAADLIDSLGILVAEQASGSMMEQYIRYEGNESASRCTSQEQVMQILTTLEAARNQNDKQKTLIAATLSVQQAMKEQIRQVNLAIQQQVMSQELLSQNRMTDALTKAINPSVKNRPVGTN